tara:strand:- start:973 stop:1209 length:237 start_codon:yes stop_codon:yes gene_type:complete
MITNPAKNLMRSFSRIPDITNQKQTPERGLLSPMRSMMRSGNNSMKEAQPLVDAVKAYQQIRKDRLEIIDMRKRNGSN